MNSSSLPRLNRNGYYMDLITCSDLSFAYEGVPVIEDLNFTVSEGDYLCIVGENGTGKSTLIKGLLRLKKPYTGEIILAPSLKARQIGYLPQQTPVQKDFPASVYEVVLSGCLNRLGFRPFYGKKEKELAYENLERLGITSLKNACYRNLSGGQQQRVLLARALCSTQKIILLDEPVSGLDPLVTNELYELIYHLNKDHHITVIMVSHDIQAALKYADKILHLRNKQLFFGSIGDYLKSDLGRNFAQGVLSA